MAIGHKAKCSGKGPRLGCPAKLYERTEARSGLECLFGSGDAPQANCLLIQNIFEGEEEGGRQNALGDLGRDTCRKRSALGAEEPERDQKNTPLYRPL